MLREGETVEEKIINRDSNCRTVMPKADNLCDQRAVNDEWH